MILNPTANSKRFISLWNGSKIYGVLESLLQGKMMIFVLLSPLRPGNIMLTFWPAF
jgi:hypothetical protein